MSTSDSVRSHIYQDRSGDLRKGYFYLFDQCIADRPIYIKGKDDPREMIVRPRNPTEDELHYSSEERDEFYLTIETILSEQEEFRECSLNPAHVTRERASWMVYAVKFNGPVADLVFDYAEGKYLFTISRDFARRLQQSGLTGVHISPATYVAPEIIGIIWSSKIWIPNSASSEIANTISANSRSRDVP